LDKDHILLKFEHDVERLTAGVVLDRIAQVQKTGEPQFTDFLDPNLSRTAEIVLNMFKQVKYINWGGYPEAERVRLMIFLSEQQAKIESIPMAFLELSSDAAVSTLSHRDFLGAVLGLGLRREKIGDIIITEEGSAQLIVAPEIVTYLLSGLLKVGKHKVSVRQIGQDELQPSPRRQRELKATVASLRLDAVASAGFGLSRSKLAPAIRAGQIKLNWQSVKSASATVKEGDVITLMGRGRIEVAAITGESKKGRLHIIIKK